ncbi:Maf family protein [Ammoniphilus resinae]|uniref:dTTP/UTP pyrophosphatase n=1 Tax=Ammoniphilus resinae TaxID=861532 RepID=A0ABS4GJH0_9BACL|nr:Maf family protein [Ammoniphilus resinae]MBP1930404.1 septum formation protein [Ammoniphilus resinae]
MVLPDKRPLILASSSPRRQEILRNLGLDFSVKVSGVDESFSDGLKPAEIVELLAERKVASVSEEVSDGLVIGSDTIVVLNNQILGKPINLEDAFRMLMSLQGSTHSVFSGLTVMDVRTGRKLTGHVETKVTMRGLSESTIKKYIATGEPSDKAGAYAIQGFGAIFIEKIEGDYFSVVGLPIRLLADFLNDFGYPILEIGQRS